jgi:Flp pilus assembly protein TadG
MILRTGRDRREPRSGVAAVELAMLAPLLAFILVVTVDWARIFYYVIVLENCARNGAYYGSDYGIYDYQNPPDAALEDTTNLTPAPVITIAYSTTPNGPYTLSTPPGTYINGGSPAYAQVTATWTFNTLSGFSLDGFGFNNTVTLSRSVDMEMAPIIPKF